MPISPSLARGARLALLLTPALLSACYIVPLGHRPAYGPYEYRPYDRGGDHRHERRHPRRDWRGELPADAAVAQANVSQTAEGPTAAPQAAPAYIDASSIDR
jgi:hypothetical protein